ncbi:MAG TPA: TVP38/TMEM64 family protein [Candidatus Nanoarchaeia archaeon]|nr:TVP38/TMEM64 family protein [Candidatus Nanoarchaeia archaeon]
MTHLKRNIGNKKILFSYIIVFLIVLFLSVYYFDKIKLVYSDPESVKNFINGFGALAPVALIIAQAAQVVIFVIPGPVFTVAGGYIFGVFLGTVYSLIGTFIGSILVFFIAKRFGRPFIEKIINKKDLEHFDYYFKKKGKTALFVTRLIPILFPNDVVSFAAGLTPLSLRSYAVISFFGFIPNILALNFFGNALSQNFNPYLPIILTLIGSSAFCYIIRHRLKKVFIYEVRVCENELALVEEKSIREVKFVKKYLICDFKRVKNEMGLIEKIVISKNRGA